MSLCFTFWIFFRLTSFLYRLKVKESKIYSMLYVEGCSSSCINECVSDIIFSMTGELWTSFKCIASGAPCRIKVGDRWDGTLEYSLFELRLYMHIDEYDVYSPSSSILIIFFRSIVALLFSTLAFWIFASWSTYIIWSRVGILDFTNTYCWLSSPRSIYSWE